MMPMLISVVWQKGEPMSVLIKDIEKPKSCYAVIDGESEYCPFVNTDDDDCVLLLEKGICERTWQGQYSKCPLVEAPESCDDAVSRKAVYVVIEEVLYETTKGADNWYGLLNDGVRTLPSVTPKRKTGEISRSIDGSTLIMWLNDWWASSFGQEETPESKAIHKVLAKVAEYIEKRTLSEEPGYVESQSEEQILECCIGLMQEMADCFREYLEFIDHEPEYEEEKQPFCFSYFHIVNRLFLWHTSHSGGTSTRAKCKELGIDDSGNNVEFYIWEDEEDES